jgi:hypothetical protein
MQMPADAHWPLDRQASSALSPRWGEAFEGSDVGRCGPGAECCAVLAKAPVGAGEREEDRFVVWVRVAFEADRLSDGTAA